MNKTRRGFIGTLLASPILGVAALIKSRPQYKDTPAEEAQKQNTPIQIGDMRIRNTNIAALVIHEGSFQFANRKVKIMTDEDGNDILVLEKENAKS